VTAAESLPASLTDPSASLPDTSARRVLTILRYLAGHQRPVLASAIARDCGFPRSSTYRLLHVMAEERFVTYYPDEGRWGLGLSAYELGTGYLLSDPLGRQAMGILVRLSAETGAFAAVGVLDGTDTIVSRTHVPETAREWADITPGVRYPAHLTAMGRALLMDRTAQDLNALYGSGPLARPTGRGPTTVDDLMRELERAVQRGSTESPAELADGITAFAAPVRSAAGRVVAAVAAGFLGDPPRGAERQRVTASLVSCAAEISARLGYRPHALPGAG
jgi:DNA-binding IclR family transcriptional regulator